MVLYFLYIKADFENVKSLSFIKGKNICVSVRNPLSDYEKREKVTFNLNETIEQDEGSREPPHHFSLKWEGAKKQSVLEVLDEAAAKSALKKKKYKGEKPRYNDSLTNDDSGTFVPILAFECRGLEPYAFHPLGDEFAVETEGGKIFDEDVDLSEGDWAEYDEESDAAVSISEFETKIESL